MQFDVDSRTAAFSVGELADFRVGPRDTGEGGPQGVWRAQLGTQWHGRLRETMRAERTDAEFEIPILGRVAHRGWVLTLNGRIDQRLPLVGAGAAAAATERAPGGVLLREIKTVLDPLPATEESLRAAYPAYFVQLATYAALSRLAPDRPPGGVIRAELVFVETGSGLSQSIPLNPGDDVLFRAQLDAVVEFLESRRLARERLRQLAFRPAFAQPRPGQENTRARLDQAITSGPGAVLFQAPTGFGKTGILLESALGLMKAGHFERVLYLTSKSTGQLQVIHTLHQMTSDSPPSPETRDPNPETAAAALPRSVAAWQVRNKAEHCVNETFLCVRESCRFLDGLGERWGAAGLSRFWRDESSSRDIATLREAGRNARVCPYEITRTGLAYSDVWVGDYNYVFAPGSRGLFFQQPGFQPERTFLIVDEGHNLPSRAADALSHSFSSLPAEAAASDLHRLRVPAALATSWDRWTHFLRSLGRADALRLPDEEDARELMAEVSSALQESPLDYAALNPGTSETLWSVAAAHSLLAEHDLPRLWWSPAAGQLVVTCLDASAFIGATLGQFGGVVIASATFGPTEAFGAACGLNRFVERVAPAEAPATPERLGELNKRQTRKLYTQLTTAAALLRVEEEAEGNAPRLVQADAPWRAGAYDVGVDARVDTTFQNRAAWHAVTAQTIAQLQRSAGTPVAVFFPSYSYAESILKEIDASAPGLRVAIQPRIKGLDEQHGWVEQSLASADALFLVVGSSFSEGIDVLGGRIGHAMVVGPALPEVNAVQKAKLAASTSGSAGLPPVSRDEAFRRVYQIPGMTKVNQALGRLVRAPRQRARVLLHCRRFAEPAYAALLAPEYQNGTVIRSDPDLDRWLKAGTFN